MPVPAKRHAIDSVVLWVERVAAKGQGLSRGDDRGWSYGDIDVNDGLGGKVVHGCAADVLDGDDRDAGGGEDGCEGLFDALEGDSPGRVVL